MGIIPLLKYVKRIKEGANALRKHIARNFTKEPSMPKMKSVKGAVKRFKVKKNGQVKRGTAFRSHILTKQDAQTRRKQNTPKVIADVDAKNIKAMIN